jgi:outer membrane protein
MSARTAAAVGVALAVALSAQAQEEPGQRPTSPARSLSDPLQVEPRVLSTGAILPGDRAPLGCPVEVDLSRPLALGDAVDLALCNSPQLQQTWAAIKQQASVLGEARAAYFPTLTASVSKLHSETTYPDFAASNSYQNGHTASASLNWRLFDFGARAANRLAAEETLNAALASHDAALQKTIGAVISSFFDAVAAKAAMDASSRASALAQKTLEATKRREARGAAAAGDTLQATTALAKAQLASQRSGGDYRKALSVLLYTLGLAPGSNVQLPSEPAPVPKDALSDLHLWLSQAQQRHPAIVAARAQWEAAKARVTLAKDEGLPTIELTGNLYRNGYPNQGLQATRSTTSTIGFMLTIPIFDGFSQRYKVKEAQAQAEQVEAQLHDTEHQVLMELVKAYADAQAALANLDASLVLQQAATAAVASAKKRYDRGAADVFEMLSSEQALAEAEQERLRCVVEWNSARLRLRASAGVLGIGLVRAQGAQPAALASDVARVRD